MSHHKQVNQTWQKIEHTESTTCCQKSKQSQAENTTQQTSRTVPSPTCCCCYSDNSSQHSLLSIRRLSHTRVIRHTPEDLCYSDAQPHTNMHKHICMQPSTGLLRTNTSVRLPGLHTSGLVGSPASLNATLPDTHDAPHRHTDRQDSKESKKKKTKDQNKYRPLLVFFHSPTPHTHAMSCVMLACDTQADMPTGLARRRNVRSKIQ